MPKRKTASELMTSKVLTVAPDWTVDQLMEFLTDHNITGAPVVSVEGKPIGVVSLTDIARNGAVSDVRSGDAHPYYRRLEDFVAPEEIRRFRVEQSGVTIRDIMTPMVFAVEEDATAQEVAEMMITGRIHRVFVKQQSKLMGVITAMDLLPLVRDM